MNAQGFAIFRLQVAFNYRESLAFSLIRLAASVHFLEQCGIASQQVSTPSYRLQQPTVGKAMTVATSEQNRTLAPVSLLILQERRERLELLIREVAERRHYGTVDISRGILEVSDQPLVGATTGTFDSKIGPHGTTLAIELMTHEAAFLFVECPSVPDQIGLGRFARRWGRWRSCRGSSGGVEARKSVDEPRQLPSISFRDAGLPGRHASETNAVLNDPKQFGITPMPHVR